MYYEVCKTVPLGAQKFAFFCINIQLLLSEHNGKPMIDKV